MADILTPPIIDPRNERTLTDEAKLYAFQRSGGLLNSTNVGDPLDVLVRTQAYAGAELLFYANKTPLAFAIKFLELTGVQRSPGTKATVTLTFRLVSARPSAFTIPAGFEVTGENNGRTYSFYTDEALTITAGNLSGTVVATAKENGSAYNITAGKIRNITQPLAFLASVINLEPAQGGSEEESAESAVARGIAALRRRSPTSAIDFEEEAELVLGAGSRCKAIGLLGIDKLSEERGAVHLFLLSSNARPATSSEIQLVRNALTPRIQLGTRLHISPMETINLVIGVIAKLEPGVNHIVVANNIWTVLQEMLNPTQYETGATVDPNEIAHQVRFAGGIAYVEEIYLNGDTLPIAMPNLYTLPIAAGLMCELVDQNGTVIQQIRGDVGASYN